MARLPCKDYFRGTCTTPFCEKWHPPECLFYKSDNGCRLREKCSYVHRQVDEQVGKRFQKNGWQKVQLLVEKLQENWVAYYKIWSRRSLHRFCGRSSNILKPIRCVQFTKAVLRHANIRDQNPLFGMICPADLHLRNTNAPKIEDGSQEETEWQERCVCETAWKMTRCILKLKEKSKPVFFSLSENWCLPAPSTPWTKEKGICCRLRSVDAHDQQIRIWIPVNWKPWRHREVRRRLLQPMVKCSCMKRPQLMSKNWKYSWQWKSSRIRSSQVFFKLVLFTTHDIFNRVKTQVWIDKNGETRAG